MRRAVVHKTISIVANILVCMIVMAGLFAVLVTVASKKDSDGTATVFGYQLRFVQSASMEKCEETDVSGFKVKSIPVRSCVFVEVAPETDKKDEWLSALRLGDVLTFKYLYTRQETITHRIVSITQKPTGGLIIELAGDNQSGEGGQLVQKIDTSLEDSPNYIIGKVRGQSYVLGQIVYALKTPVGIVCIVIVPCLILIALQVMRITGVFRKEKGIRRRAAEIRQSDEIEELKRQLKELQNESASGCSEGSTASKEQNNTNLTNNLNETRLLSDEVANGWGCGYAASKAEKENSTYRMISDEPMPDVTLCGASDGTDSDNFALSADCANQNNIVQTESVGGDKWKQQ